ncbi:hypothetical protein [Rhodoferax antarcticus]|uniref:Uncharacterized protein n=1 Tax=Rhodoferax antarcticus ANT.BR TaxID=1111071 RepID=A0A1Q8Y9B4_9BURK|nr:hypothetical protein [Rhodoferax antarcticus]OLP04615.1 hypothetical protein BLL52_4287 [Rhodoferax antarcticus ANT.BR]
MTLLDEIYIAQRNAGEDAVIADLECMGLAPLRPSSQRALMSTPPTATLDWSLRVECPKCKHENDLADGVHDTENTIARHIFSNDWDKLAGWGVTCQHCAHEFTLGCVEY